jgi:hypothetical protein
VAGRITTRQHVPGALLYAIATRSDTALDTARLAAITICNKVAEYATDSRRAVKNSRGQGEHWYDDHTWVRKLKAALSAASRRTFTVREDVVNVFHELPLYRHISNSVTLCDVERGELEQGPCRSAYNVLVAEWDNVDKSGRVIGHGKARYKLEHVHVSDKWARLPNGDFTRIADIERARQAQRE